MPANHSPSAPLAPPSDTRGPAPARRTHVSLIAWAPDGDLDFNAWILEGRRIGGVARGSAWWVGDWLDYGTEKWGERYTKASKITGYDPKTLRNLRYVAAHIPPSLRRDDLTWSHHALLAALMPDAQRRWLERAATDRLTVDDLRLELRRTKRDEDHRAGGEGHAVQHTTSSTSPASSRRPPSPDVLLCPQCGYRLAHELPPHDPPTTTGTDPP